jgi:hypothetical protein
MPKMNNVIRKIQLDDRYDDITLVGTREQLEQQAAAYDRQHLSDEDARQILAAITDAKSGVLARFDRLQATVCGKLDACRDPLDRVVTEDDGEVQ